MDSVTLTIDGREITVAKGTTVLRAALEHGITIPYYCYHPGIGIEGSCRVCIVKIEKMPKLQTSCSTVCADDMVVHTRTPEVIEARAGVFEFLLANHPLDCPVCDKGGECPLQDFSYAFGPSESRMDLSRRVFDGEGVGADVNFGPTLMLNRNRCILCTRCVRFMRDIAGDAQIGIIDRGAGSEIATFREQGVHSLLSGNLVDICPVGAITTREYRFKSRPWDNVGAVDTICTQCSKGCNTTAWVKAKPEWVKGPRIVRVTPRYNADVNGYWMCDIGRFGFRWIEGEDRLQQPLVRPAGNGARVQRAVPWRDLISDLGDRLTAALRSNPEGVRFLLSAHASHEELFLLRRLAQRLLGGAAAEAVTLAWRYHAKSQPAGAKFTVPAVDAPNLEGARMLGLAPGKAGDPSETVDLALLRAAVAAGRVSALYVFDPGPDGSIGDTQWIVEARERGAIPLVVFQGVLATRLARVADFVLPGASYVEKEASYTNDQGRLQGTSRVIAPPGEAMEDWQILVNLGTALGVAFAYASAADVRADIARQHADHPALAGIGTLVFEEAAGARQWLQASNPSERGKWNILFKDLPPVKGAVDPSALPLPAGAIPLRPVSKSVAPRASERVE